MFREIYHHHPFEDLIEDYCVEKQNKENASITIDYNLVFRSLSSALSKE